MINKITYLLLGVVFILLLGGCKVTIYDDAEDDVIDSGIDYEVNEEYETNPQDITIADKISIYFTTNGVEISNPFSEKGISIVETNGHVVIISTITDTEVNYVLSGNTTDGSVKIYSDYKFSLVLNGVSIINKNGPAINIQSKKKTTLTLVENTSNRFVDSSVYPDNSEEDMKAALFSEGQIVFEGSGSLVVVGCYKHAICSDDYVLIENGNITIEVAAKDAIHTKDYFQMNGGSLTITDSKDNGIECDEGYIIINEGKLTINCSNDGIIASYSGSDIDPYIQINGGDIAINTSAQKGMGIKTESSLTVNNCNLMNITVAGSGSKAIKATKDVTFVNGTANLKTTGSAYYDTTDKDITSPAGINCDGNFVMQGGNIAITSSGSAGKGISADGTLTIDDGILTVTTSGGQFKYGNENSASKAIKSTGNLTINGGTITVKTSATEAEGIESKKTLTINGGNIEVNAYDDGINAATNITINGGNIYCYSTTNDGIDSNGTLTITGGTIVSSGSTSPEEGFDCDNNTFKITGGTIIGVGGATSTPTSSVTTQRCLLFGNSGSANQLVNIQANDTSIMTFNIPRAYSSMVMVFSSPQLQSGTTYTIYKGGSISEGSSFHGLYLDGTYTAGTSAGTFTASSMVTTVGSVSNGGGGGGGWR